MRTPMTRALVAAALLAAPAFAAAGALDADLAAAYATPPADYLTTRDALLAADMGDAELAQAAAEAEWQVRLQAAALEVWREQPELAAAAWSAEPMITRARFYRFTETWLSNPEATAVLLERLAHADEHHEIRAALVEVIGRSIGEDKTAWSAPLAGMFSQESSADVRASIAFEMRRAPIESAGSTLRLALRDGDASVRAEAMRSVAWREDGEGFAAEIAVGLSDADAEVRAAAARAAGWRGVQSLTGALEGALADGDADVRFNALRSIERLAPEQAVRLAAQSGLTEDADPRVARLAAKLAN
jgi:hypothetical protein